MIYDLTERIFSSSNITWNELHIAQRAAMSQKMEVVDSARGIEYDSWSLNTESVAANLKWHLGAEMSDTLW